MIHIKSGCLITGYRIGNSHRLHKRTSHRVYRIFHAVTHRKNRIFIHHLVFQHRCKNRAYIHTGSFILISVIVLFFLLKRFQVCAEHLTNLLNGKIRKLRFVFAHLFCDKSLKGILLHHTHLIVHNQRNHHLFINFIQLLFGFLRKLIDAVFKRVKALPCFTLILRHNKLCHLKFIFCK